MDAIKFDSNTKILSLVKTDIPKISHPREVLVKVYYSGVCGTDLHIIEGNFPSNNDFPVTLGHEFTGVVEDFGTGVDNLNINDRVVVDPNNGCNKCEFCRIGNPHFCENPAFYRNLGLKNNGGWAKYVLCAVEQVHKIPDTVTFQQAGLAEPLSCIVHGFDLMQPLNIGQKILINGAGIIGTLWACLLHAKGHRKVTISEPNPSRLSSLKNLKTDFELIQPSNLPPDNENGTFDVVIDCSGFSPAIENGFSLLKSGGRICLFGVAPPTARISVSPYDLFVKEKTIVGVKVNPFSFPKAIGLIESLGDRYLDYRKLGVGVFELSQYQEALELLTSGRITKAMFQMQ